jgi:hypothetical protein
MDDELFQQVRLQVQDEIRSARLESAVLAMGLYNFLIREGLVSRQSVHEHLSRELSRIDDDDRKARIKKTLVSLAAIFEDDRPMNTRRSFRVIKGGQG